MPSEIFCHTSSLTYYPQANYRTQLILRADILQGGSDREYLGTPQILLVNGTTIEEIINAKTLECQLIHG